MLIHIIKKILIRLYTIILRQNFLGLESDLDPRVEFKNPRHIKIHNNVHIRPFVWMYAVTGNRGVTGLFHPFLEIQKGCSIGRFCHIVCANQIVLCENVLVAEGVLITDNNHGYKDINQPVMFQPLEIYGPIIIGAGTWIGEGVRIIGRVSIGKNCVIGANSVLTNIEVPDYSVVVGNPPVIVKKYDLTLKTWVKER